MGKRKPSPIPSMAAAIHLAPRRKPRWIMAAQHHAWSGELVELGFEALGTFAILEMPDVLIDAYAHHTHPVVGVITQHPIAGLLADLDAYWTDGRGISIANSAAVGQLDQMPGHTTLSFPDAGIARLWKEMRKRLEPGAIAFTSETFPRFFEAWYAKEMEWRMNKGFNEEEVRRTSAALGDNPDEETIRFTTEAMNSGKLPESAEAADPAAFEEMIHAVAENPLKPMDLCKPTGPMAKAIRKAIRGWDGFLETWRTKPKSVKAYLVRLRLRFRGKDFHAWVRMKSESKSGFTGRSAHAKDFGPLKKMAEVRFKSDQVTDWAYRGEPLWHGHHSALVLGERMRKASLALEAAAEKESQKLIREIGRDFAALFQGTAPNGKEVVPGRRKPAAKARKKARVFP